MGSSRLLHYMSTDVDHTHQVIRCKSIVVHYENFKADIVKLHVSDVEQEGLFVLRVERVPFDAGLPLGLPYPFVNQTDLYVWICES